MKLAPIVVFAYDRPEHLKRTIEALAKNVYAKASELYIYCDGPKKDATEERKLHIKQTREVAHAVCGFKELHIIEAEQNKGLANSIIGGVTEVINKHGRVIVLEDDLLTSPYFLKYMNEALDKYESYPSVFSIGGYNFPPQKMRIPKDYPYDAYVSLRCSSWGWATWKGKWVVIEWSLDYFDDFLKKSEQIQAFNRGGNDLTHMLIMQREHRIDSWAIRYTFQHFYHHAVTILPCISYVDNIGFDGTGEHCGIILNDFHNDITKAPENPKWLDVLYEDKRIINAFYTCCSADKLPVWKRAIRKIYRILGAVPPACIETKVYM